MKYGVGDVVHCYASANVINPVICGIVTRADIFASLYEFTIIAQRKVGFTSYKDFILLVPESVPPEIGWVVDLEWLNQTPYNISSSYIGFRVIGCNEEYIVDFAPINQSTVMPITLSNKEKELCETIDILEKELKEKDQAISKLKEQLARLDWHEVDYNLHRESEWDEPTF